MSDAIRQKKKRKLRSKIIFFTIAVCVSALLICGASVFAASVSTLSEKILNDVVFFLNETNGNLKNKGLLLEDTVLNLRNDSTVDAYLRAAGDFSACPYTDREIATQFQRCVNIFSDKNTAGGAAPFVEKAYLFSRGAPHGLPAYYKSLYYSYLQEEEAKLDAYYTSLNLAFTAGGKEVAYFPNGDGTDLVLKLYSHEMEHAGTLIFHISTATIAENMRKTGDYPDSFWMVYGRDGRALAASGRLPSQEAALEIAAIFRNAPYECLTDGKSYLVSTVRMSMGLSSTIAVPKDQISAMLYASVQIYVLLMLVLIPAILVVAFLVTYRLTSPLKTVTDKIKLVGEGQFEAKLPDFNTQEFSEVSEVFNKMTDEIKYLITDVYQKKLAVQESELKFLQSQMNPHFMFNVLNTIALKAKMDGNSDVYDMINSFAQLTQARIYHSDTDKVPLKEELKYIRFYLSLQSLRFGEKLAYSIECKDDALLGLSIPKLCIEPIVENAVVHGLEPKRGKGKIRIEIGSEDGGLTVRVEDDGVGFETQLTDDSPTKRRANGDESHNNVGLFNAHRIIQHFYGPAYGVTIRSAPGAGSAVTIRLPFDAGNKNDGGTTECTE